MGYSFGYECVAHSAQLDTHSHPNLYPAQVDTHSGNECVAHSAQLDTHSHPNLYPAQVDTHLDDECVSLAGQAATCSREKDPTLPRDPSLQDRKTAVSLVDGTKRQLAGV